MDKLIPAPVSVVFVDHTDTSKDPVLLGNPIFASAPAFSIGENITFKHVKVGEENSVDIRGDKATHKVKNIHWSFTVLQNEEGQDETDPRAILIITLEQIAVSAGMNIHQVKNAFF